VGDAELTNVFCINKSTSIDDYDIHITRYMIACNFEYDLIDVCKALTSIVLTKLYQKSCISASTPVCWYPDADGKTNAIKFNLASRLNLNSGEIWIYVKHTLAVPETRVVTRDDCFLSKPATHESIKAMLEWIDTTINVDFAMLDEITEPTPET
jgi:hypothetical protein